MEKWTAMTVGAPAVLGTPMTPGQITSEVFMAPPLTIAAIFRPHLQKRGANPFASWCRTTSYDAATGVEGGLWRPARRAALGALGEAPSTTGGPWRLYQRAVNQGGGVVGDNIDLRMDIGDTTIIRHANVGHWRLEGAAITLAQLFRDFGEHLTAMEHPVGNADERAAAHERKAV